MSELDCRMRLYCVLSGFLLLALAISTGVFAADDEIPLPGEIPDSVKVVAEAYLDEWCERATRNPEFYGVVGKDVDRQRVSLGEAYIYYVLQRPATERFAESAENDPTRFATLVQYEFPLLLAGELVLTVHVIKNEDLEGRVLLPEKGEYVVSGGRESGLPFDSVDSVVGRETNGWQSPLPPSFFVVNFYSSGAIFVHESNANGVGRYFPVSITARNALSMNESAWLDENTAISRIKRRFLEELELRRKSQ
ncbi:MAG: hypothetical protein P8181_00730 [bacterium]